MHGIEVGVADVHAFQNRRRQIVTLPDGLAAT
jgi:hypothetical protein